MEGVGHGADSVAGDILEKGATDDNRGGPNEIGHRARVLGSIPLEDTTFDMNIVVRAIIAPAFGASRIAQALAVAQAGIRRLIVTVRLLSLYIVTHLR